VRREKKQFFLGKLSESQVGGRTMIETFLFCAASLALLHANSRRVFNAGGKQRNINGTLERHRKAELNVNTLHKKTPQGIQIFTMLARGKQKLCLRFRLLALIHCNELRIKGRVEALNHSPRDFNKQKPFSAPNDCEISRFISTIHGENYDCSHVRYWISFWASN
jgi:hypothetical protein